MCITLQPPTTTCCAHIGETVHGIQQDLQLLAVGHQVHGYDLRRVHATATLVRFVVTKLTTGSRWRSRSGIRWYVLEGGRSSS